MIRIVLVGWSDHDWRVYRQPGWMAEVRRSPEASKLPRRHFDIDEAAFKTALEAWKPVTSGSSLDAALESLGRHGAVEVVHS